MQLLVVARDLLVITRDVVAEIDVIVKEGVVVGLD